MVNDNGGNDAGSVTVLQESLDSVRAVGRVHHTEAANITDIRVPGRRRSKAVPLELSDRPRNNAEDSKHTILP